MEKSGDWFEDDEFWERMHAFMFRMAGPELTSAQIDGVLSLTGVPAGAAVLDLCCGPGRHSLELARRSFRVTAVDRTESYLHRLRSTAEIENLDIEIIGSDMRKFVRRESFDLAINLFTSFGYFDDPGDDRVVASQVCQSLAPGGKFVVETIGKEVIARIYQRRWWSEVDEMVVLEERRVQPGWTGMDNRWIVYRGDRGTEYRFRHRLYSAVELMTLLREGGFSEVRAFGGLDGSPYDQSAKRLVVVGTRATV